VVKESHRSSMNQGGTPTRGAGVEFLRPRTSLNGSLQHDASHAKQTSERQGGTVVGIEHLTQGRSSNFFLG
jgi:hypothetical protein